MKNLKIKFLKTQELFIYTFLMRSDVFEIIFSIMFALKVAVIMMRMMMISMKCLRPMVDW